MHAVKVDRLFFNANKFFTVNLVKIYEDRRSI